MSRILINTFTIITLFKLSTTQNLRNKDIINSTYLESEVSVFDNMNYFIYQNSRINDYYNNSTELNMIINITETIRLTLFLVGLY